MRLNFTEYNSFMGDILPLTLKDFPFEAEGVEWSCSDEGVLFLRTFDFSNGCVVALINEGEAETFAQVNGVKTSCHFNVRKRITYSGGKLNKYFADLHTHTSMNHNGKTFPYRDKKEWAVHSLTLARDDGFLDAMAVTDHGCVLNDLEFFRTLLAGKELETAEFITFPGSESEVSERDTDSWGILRKNSGEVVTINACGYSDSPSWATYFEDTFGNPFTIGGFAHPQIYGTPASHAPGIWNFSLETKTTDAHRRRFKFVELGNGEDRGGNLINEGVYSLALDCGYHLAPAMNSDCHEIAWGRNAMPGRTVIYAENKSHEAFTDALLSSRFYATESGDVALDVTVNSCISGSTLPATDKYEFDVSLASFGQNIKPKRLEVISDCGKTIYECKAHYGKLNFTISSDTASYFYLRLTDEKCLRTWSAPFFTGRKNCFTHTDVSKMSKIPNVKCIENDKVTNGNPYDSYLASSPVATLNFDLGAQRTVKAIGYYPHLSAFGEPVGQDMSQITQSRFMHRAEIYISDDGEHYTFLKEALYRAFGGEQAVSLETTCRYIRLVTESIGHYLSDRGYDNQPVQIGEITFYN